MRRAIIDGLHRVEGRAELIDGRIVHYMPDGFRVGRIRGRIQRSLGAFAERVGRGEPYGATVAFVVPALANGRESFSPSVSYYDGPLPDDPMDFLPGPPTFAVEVRSKSDHGTAADRDYAAKRDDYFEAGTLVVWDVDPDAGTVTKHTPTGSRVFSAGDAADAEPALPGWSLPLADIFG